MKKRFTVKASTNKASRKRGRIMASNGYDPYTENLADFGYREYEELKRILDAWFDGDGLPDDFDGDGVRPAFNRSSGNVFLVNDENQVCMVTNDGKLESWYSTPYNGEEGFYDDLMYIVDDRWEAEDIEYLRDLAENRGDTEAVERLNAMLGETE